MLLVIALAFVPASDTTLVIAALAFVPASDTLLVIALAIVLTSDTPGNGGRGVMVADVVFVSDEVDLAVVVAKTVGAELVDLFVGAVNAEAVGASVTSVAFAEIGAAAAATPDRNAGASERADDAADGVA